MIDNNDHLGCSKEFIPIEQIISGLDRESRGLFERSHFGKMLHPRKGYGLTNPFVERDCDRAPVYASYNSKTGELILDEDEAYRLQVYEQRGVREVNVEFKPFFGQEFKQEKIAFLIVKYPTHYDAIFSDFPDRIRRFPFLINPQEILEQPDIFTEAVKKSIKEYQGESVYVGAIDNDRVGYISRVADEANRDSRLNLRKLEMAVNEEKLPPLEVFWKI